MRQRMNVGRPRGGGAVAAGWWGVVGTILLVLIISPGSIARAKGSEARDAQSGSAWRHLTMDDLGVDVSMFVPHRGRYLQTTYDLEGEEEIQGRDLVHLDVDRAVHSGVWNGEVPIVLEPLREPGLVISWQVQNALYNAIDRVLTDSRLSLWNRLMPLGTGGVRWGVVDGTRYTLVRATPSDDDEATPTSHASLEDGALNVLTLPYALAAMNLEVGERFTLPGYAMFGGADGGGIHWRGAVTVASIEQRTVGGRSLEVREVLFTRMDERNGLTVEAIDYGQPGQKVTRLLISPEPPYLLARANLVTTEEGGYRFVRERLELVDWAPQPLPASDLTSDAIWRLDLDEGSFGLRPESVPEVRVSAEIP